MKVLVVDDHPLFRDAIAHLVGQLGEGVEVLAAGDSETALAIVRSRADLRLALVDLNMPKKDGIVLLERFRELRPSLPVAVVTGSEDPDDLRRATQSGAVAYLAKFMAAADMVAALRAVLRVDPATPVASASHARGKTGTGLTVRQLEVLALLCQGRSNKEIALEMILSEPTVKAHIAAIFRALKVANRTQAVLAAQRIGIGGS